MNQFVNQEELQATLEKSIEKSIEALIEKKINEMLQSDPQVLSAPKVVAKVCSVPGCTVESRAKGFCNPHYQQWRRKTLCQLCYD